MSVNERKQVRDFFIRLAICAAFSFLYSAGGSSDFGGHKWLRRFLAPTILCGGMFYFSYSWKSIVGLPLMFGSLSLGYGSDIEIWKIIKRGIYGIANGLSSSIDNMLNKRMILAIFQPIMLIAAYIAFGVYNPFPNARIEEGVLGFLIAFIPMMSVRR